MRSCIDHIQMVRLPSMVPQQFYNLLHNNDNGRVVAICLLTSVFTVMPVGYHMVVLNVPEKVIQNSISDSLSSTFGISIDKGAMSILWSVIVSCQALGALIGCSVVSPILSKYGTKSGMMTFNNFLLVIGSVAMTSSALFNFSIFLIIGRFLIGIYTGIACALLPLYVQQIAPKEIKGSLSCFLHIAVCFGSAIGAIFSLDFMLGSQANWGYLLGLPGLLGIAQIIAAFFIPDTPNHLLQHGSYSRAISSINFYYDIEGVDEDDAIKSYWDMVPEVPQQITLIEGLRNKTIRKGMLLGMAVSATQIFSGSMATVSYSSSMFTAVSFIDVLVPFLPALGSIISIIMTVPALELVETSGRRPLLLSTLIICIISDCFLLIFSLLSVDPAETWASWAFAVSFFLYGIGYNLGTGPVSYFIAAELVPAEAASLSLGVAVATNWLCSLVTTFSYYPLMTLIGGWSYLLFIIPTSMLLVILWIWLPETRFYYKEDSIEAKLLQDLGQPYGTFAVY
ncbi:unnamed protein product [Auanema sp. JU1783]|nr:unnamed protein product [Auanema sp. JU1783]